MPAIFCSPEQGALAFLEVADLDQSEGNDIRPILQELLRLFHDNAQGLFLREQLNFAEGRVEAAAQQISTPLSRGPKKRPPRRRPLATTTTCSTELARQIRTGR